MNEAIPTTNNDDPDPSEEDEWICDICKVARFPTLEEAEEHENQCSVAPPKKQTTEQTTIIIDTSSTNKSSYVVVSPSIAANNNSHNGETKKQKHQPRNGKTMMNLAPIFQRAKADNNKGQQPSNSSSSSSQKSASSQPKCLHPTNKSSHPAGVGINQQQQKPSLNAFAVLQSKKSSSKGDVESSDKKKKRRKSNNDEDNNNNTLYKKKMKKQDDVEDVLGVFSAPKVLDLCGSSTTIMSSTNETTTATTTPLLVPMKQKKNVPNNKNSSLSGLHFPAPSHCCCFGEEASSIHSRSSNNIDNSPETSPTINHRHRHVNLKSSLQSFAEVKDFQFNLQEEEKNGRVSSISSSNCVEILDDDILSKDDILINLSNIASEICFDFESHLSAYLNTNKLCKDALSVDKSNKHVFQCLRNFVDRFIESHFLHDEECEEEGYEDDDECKLWTKVVVVHGFGSSGKSSLIDIFAQSCGYKIFEAHSGEKRDSSMLKKCIEGACVSRGLVGKKAMVLIDHPEILSEQDTNFWPAVRTIIAKTKIPIIITTNSVDFVESILGSNMIRRSDEMGLGNVVECEMPSKKYSVYRLCLEISFQLLQQEEDIVSSIRYSQLQHFVQVEYSHLEYLVSIFKGDLRHMFAEICAFRSVDELLGGFKEQKVPLGEHQSKLKDLPVIAEIVNRRVCAFTGGSIQIHVANFCSSVSVRIASNMVSFSVLETNGTTAVVEVVIPPLELPKRSESSLLDQVVLDVPLSNKFLPIELLTFIDGVSYSSNCYSDFKWNIIYKFSNPHEAIDLKKGDEQDVLDQNNNCHNNYCDKRMQVKEGSSEDDQCETHRPTMLNNSAFLDTALNQSDELCTYSAILSENSMMDLIDCHTEQDSISSLVTVSGLYPNSHESSSLKKGIPADTSLETINLERQRFYKKIESGYFDLLLTEGRSIFEVDLLDHMSCLRNICQTEKVKEETFTSSNGGESDSFSVNNISGRSRRRTRSKTRNGYVHYLNDNLMWGCNTKRYSKTMCECNL